MIHPSFKCCDCGEQINSCVCNPSTADLDLRRVVLDLVKSIDSHLWHSSGCALEKETSSTCNCGHDEVQQRADILKEYIVENQHKLIPPEGYIVVYDGNSNQANPIPNRPEDRIVVMRDVEKVRARLAKEEFEKTEARKQNPLPLP